MYARPGPSFYENEVYHLQVEARMESSKPLGNMSVNVLLGMDELVPPDEEQSVYYNLSVPGEPIIYFWQHNGQLNITPSLTNQRLLGQLTQRNETVNLTYEMTVNPARILLEAYLLLTPNHTGYDELTWTDVHVLLVNKGGEGATNLVIDLRYAGRITSTHYVNLVPPLGNTIISPRLRPLYGHEILAVHVVSGQVAPGLVANLTLEVTPRPILGVIWVKAAPEEIVSGEKVHIRALVGNQGNATSSGQLVEMMVDGSVVANTSMEDLGPGNETVVSANWTLTGKGTHTVAARAEGDEFAADPVAVEVKAASPSIGTWAVILTLFLVSLAARRSR